MKNSSILIVVLSFVSFLVLGSSIAMAGSPTGGSKEEPKTTTTQKTTPATPGIDGPTGESVRETPKKRLDVEKVTKPGMTPTPLALKFAAESKVCADEIIKFPDTIVVEIKKMGRPIEDGWCTIGNKSIVDKCNMGPGFMSVTVHCLKSGSTNLTVTLRDSRNTEHTVTISMTCK